MVFLLSSLSSSLLFSFPFLASSSLLIPILLYLSSRTTHPVIPYLLRDLLSMIVALSIMPRIGFVHFAHYIPSRLCRATRSRGHGRPRLSEPLSTRSCLALIVHAKGGKAWTGCRSLSPLRFSFLSSRTSLLSPRTCYGVSPAPFVA